MRYDGSAKTLASMLLQTWRDEGRLVVVCPEVAAGFGTPRRPAEIQLRRNGHDVLNGTARIRDAAGADVTALFIDGARLALQQALAHDCRYALLADGSPSCGSSFIHDGTFSRVAHPAAGVTAALLERHGIRVFAPDGIDELAAWIDVDR
ncbi:Purine nucleoside phosphorylase [Paraburkholderia caribensis MBA4]|uniref:Purine nucleoside phosphorylase n=1 Tax=Paraburkholderia caribensis MBA4 TaxID=1323664 RepID=A0A0P0R9J2_9BURK|nr:Purine nucleoside phosphorylase [Paraburkholderia caribensis MBA4]